MDKRLLAITLLALSAISLESHAQLHKCISSEGKATYTDQPCASKPGQKSEVANDEAIRKITALSKV